MLPENNYMTYISICWAESESKTNAWSGMNQRFMEILACISLHLSMAFETTFNCIATRYANTYCVIKSPSQSSRLCSFNDVSTLRAGRERIGEAVLLL